MNKPAIELNKKMIRIVKNQILRYDGICTQEDLVRMSELMAKDIVAALKRNKLAKTYNP